jgi:HTH-type transcriptional regulator/antitoxin HipB
MKKPQQLSPQELGALVKKRRRQLNLKQPDLALTSGTGVRFISDLENGKATCQIGLSLKVLSSLGLYLSITDSPAPTEMP